MNTKLLLGLAVVGGAAFFLTRKKDDGAVTTTNPGDVSGPRRAPTLTPEQLRAMSEGLRARGAKPQSELVKSITESLAGPLLPIDGKTGTYQNLVAQIRAREIQSGVV
jgi:hypothetical protein